MKLSTQQKKMGEIYSLLSQDLGYIYGSRESGPNGAKKEFIRKSASFLRQLGKDLGFTEMKVNSNPAGIAVSGEVSLYGMWDNDNGVFFQITQAHYRTDLLYREIVSLKDFRGGPNKWLSISIFKEMDYQSLCDTFCGIKHKEAKNNAA